ncbi:class I SAM-dependent methyltransferase [Flammeovirga pectinis]|uniref:Class I SAM-dependent methyltransferase n=1 Tax=Flammeovirga pectinis TaxID=2494373 RepID=A0A3S9P5A9_9BACT|nr:class I SAM-dependent methyltransferase [Flammeovirga pectinis]AZQ63391.1 class I SAM-dependent methyltransferase [Flammeovirga pectinis]
MDYQKEFNANKEQWNARVEGHVASKMYDVPGFKRGDTSLKKIDLEGLGDLTGKRVLHLQCHFGLDTMSLSRMGAKAVGLDISDTAIDQARQLNQELGLDAEFICSNVYDIREHLSTDEKFDMVFVSYGALCWLPDLEAWADIVSDYLKEKGTFYMVEMHPFIYTLNWATFVPEFSYYNKGVYEEKVEGSYAGDVPLNLTEYFWVHSISEMLNPLLKRGFTLDKFEEYDFQTYNCFDDMIERADGEFIFKNIKVDVPYLIELKLTK